MKAESWHVEGLCALPRFCHSQPLASSSMETSLPCFAMTLLSLSCSAIISVIDNINIVATTVAAAVGHFTVCQTTAASTFHFRVLGFLSSDEMVQAGVKKSRIFKAISIDAVLSGCFMDLATCQVLQAATAHSASI